MVDIKARVLEQELPLEQWLPFAQWLPLAQWLTLEHCYDRDTVTFFSSNIVAGFDVQVYFAALPVR